MSEIPSVSRLLKDIGKSFGLGPKAEAAPAAEAPIAATPPSAGEAVGASPTPVDLPVNPASLLPPVPEEEWQRARLAVDTRGSTGEAMRAAVPDEVPVPAPAPAFDGEPRDLSEEDVRAMFGPAAVAPSAEVPAPPPAEELPDWLQTGQGEAPTPMPPLEQSTVAGKTGTVEEDVQRGMEQFAAGLGISFEDKAREYAARIATGEDSKTMGVPEAFRARVSQLVSRDKVAALEAPELSKERGPVEASAPDLPKEFTPDASALYIPGVTPTTETPLPATPGEEAPALGTANLDKRSLEEETNKRGWEEVVGEMCDDPFFTAAYGSTGSAIAASAAYQLRDEISRGAIDKGTFTFRAREVAKVVEGQRKSEGSKAKLSLPELKKEMAENPISKIAFDATKSTVAAAVGYELSPQITSGSLEKAEFITLVKNANALMNGLPI